MSIDYNPIKDDYVPGDDTSQQHAPHHNDLENRIDALQQAFGEGTIGVPVGGDATNALRVQKKKRVDWEGTSMVTPGGRPGMVQSLLAKNPDRWDWAVPAGAKYPTSRRREDWNKKDDEGSGTGTGGGTGTYSNIPKTAPGPCREVEAVAGEGKVKLSWLSPNTGGGTVTDFIFEQQTADSFSWLWSRVTDAVSAATDYTVMGLTPGEQYTFRIRAKNAKGEGPAVETLPVTPLAVTTPPPVTPGGVEPIVVQASAFAVMPTTEVAEEPTVTVMATTAAADEPAPWLDGPEFGDFQGFWVLDENDPLEKPQWGNNGDLWMVYDPDSEPE